VPAGREVDDAAVVPIGNVQLAGGGYKHTCGCPQPIGFTIGLKLIDNLDSTPIEVNTDNAVVACVRHIHPTAAGSNVARFLERADAQCLIPAVP